MAKKRTVKRTLRRRKIPSQSIRALVKREIHRNIENKSAYHSYALTGHNSSIANMGDAIQVFPNIQKSINENGRVGAHIKQMSMVVRGHFILSTIGNETTSTFKHNIAVRVMCVKVKQFRNVKDAINNYSIWMPSLLSKGSSGAAFTGVIDDLYADLNTDVVTKKYDKIFRVSQGYYNTGDNSYPPSLNTAKMFSFNIKDKSLLRYDDSVDSGLTPTNSGYVMLLGYVFLDGTTPDTVSTTINMAFNTSVKYEDA